MISFNNFSKYYQTKAGRSYVFRDVNLDIPTDRSIGVLGPNGAGKSTLIRILGGAERLSKGRIDTELKLSWPMGLQGGLQGSMTGRENTRFVARIHGYRNTKSIEQKVENFAEIGRYFDEPVRHYSSGMRSKVTFGLTMAFDFDFDLLLIDEIGAVGDAKFKEKSRALLKEKYAKTKVMMVNHSMSELRKNCQAGIVILNQKIHFHAELNSAIKHYEEHYVRAK